MEEEGKTTKKVRIFDIPWKPVRDVAILMLAFLIIEGFLRVNEIEGAMRLADILFGSLIGILGTGKDK